VTSEPVEAATPDCSDENDNEMAAPRNTNILESSKRWVNFSA